MNFIHVRHNFLSLSRVTRTFIAILATRYAANWPQPRRQRGRCVLKKFSELMYVLKQVKRDRLPLALLITRMRASDGSALAIRRFAVRPRPTTRLTTFVKRVVCPCRGKRVQHSHSGGKRVTIHCCDRRACSRVSNVSSNSPFTVKLFISYEHENRSFSICL